MPRFVLFLGWALIFLFQKETEQAFERAVIIVFALMCALIAVVLILAYIVRKRTGARWTVEEALEMAGEEPSSRDQP